MDKQQTAINHIEIKLYVATHVSPNVVIDCCSIGYEKGFVHSNNGGLFGTHRLYTRASYLACTPDNGKH